MLTVIVNKAEVSPSPLLAVMVYSVSGAEAYGVPLITPVYGFKTRPVGSAGSEEKLAGPPVREGTMSELAVPYVNVCGES